MLADVAEFKAIDLHPTKSDLMPNSSFFKFFPTKFDLTLKDLERLCHSILNSLNQWAEQPVSGKPGLSQELAKAMTTDESAVVTALHEAALIWKKWRQTNFQTTLHMSENSQGLQINLYTRLALNFLTIHAGIIRAYQDLQGKNPQRSLSLKSYRDLMIIGTAVFFEEDRFQNIWKIDEFLFLKFIPLCYQFAD